jgi:hypothetical protein
MQSNLSAALDRIAALEGEVKTLARLLATILRGGAVELSTVKVERHPVSNRVENLRTSRRLTVDEGSVLIERRQFENFQAIQTETLAALVNAVQFAERAAGNAHAAGNLVADLGGIVRELANAHGLRVVIADGRATLVRENAADTLAAGRCTFQRLAWQAAADLKKELAADIQRVIREEAEYLRNSRRPIDAPRRGARSTA